MRKLVIALALGVGHHRSVVGLDGGRDAVSGHLQLPFVVGFTPYAEGSGVIPHRFDV